MIGISCRDEEGAIVREFFELFKTPWEFYREERLYDVVIAAAHGEKGAVPAKLVLLYGTDHTDFDQAKGISTQSRRDEALIELEEKALPIYSGLVTFKGEYPPLLPVRGTAEWAALRVGGMDRTVLRVGFNLWAEIGLLLSRGQPAENALIPTLELHIALLRIWIVEAGIPVVEIPPIPAGHMFITCLTHDVDFLRIRDYGLDSTMLGFLYRASLGSLLALLRGRLSQKKLLTNWKALASLPFVYLGLCRDFWYRFQEYAAVENGSRSTFFIIPFKNRPGDSFTQGMGKLRMVRYDIDDVRETVRELAGRGFEIGVHGIDAWHDVERAREERNRVAPFSVNAEMGIRIHWLCFSEESFKILGEAGFSYDSSFGYNHAIGYKGGTAQVFRPIGADSLLELPLHVQDTALFSFRRLNLSEEKAWDLCHGLIENARLLGGVLTIVWHDRSMAPERLWGDFYVRLLRSFKEECAWCAPAGEVVAWFRKRRALTFDRVVSEDGTVRISLSINGDETSSRIDPPVMVRVHVPSEKSGKEPQKAVLKTRHVDVPWKGESMLEIPLEVRADE